MKRLGARAICWLVFSGAVILFVCPIARAGDDDGLLPLPGRRDTRSATQPANGAQPGAATQPATQPLDSNSTSAVLGYSEEIDKDGAGKGDKPRRSRSIVEVLAEESRLLSLAGRGD